ncbi:MAG: DUF1801 domain-containing protein [Erysipelotrichales bacterium]|nr:DUF1801 domain-containing protein [Erysipelotrichales bacterium]
MDEQVKAYIDKYPKEIIDMFNILRNIIYENMVSKPEEILWARLPSYYVGESFVRFIPFKNHINIEAKVIIKYKEQLSNYKITPKGMLQIYLKQDIPVDVLKQVFIEKLN